MEENKRGLNPVGLDLHAYLLAYEEAQAEMTEEEKNAQNQGILTGKESFTLSYEEVEKKRAAIRIAELKGVPVADGEKDVNTLEREAQRLNAPGLVELVRFLGRDESTEG